jgi:hypothetical protein
MFLEIRGLLRERELFLVEALPAMGAARAAGWGWVRSLTVRHFSGAYLL